MAIRMRRWQDLPWAVPGVSFYTNLYPEDGWTLNVERAQAMADTAASTGWTWNQLQVRFLEAGRPPPPFQPVETPKGIYISEVRAQYDALRPVIDQLRAYEGFDVLGDSFQWGYHPSLTPEECFTREIVPGDGHAYPHCRYPIDIQTALSRFWLEPSSSFSRGIDASSKYIYRTQKVGCDAFDEAFIQGAYEAATAEALGIAASEDLFWSETETRNPGAPINRITIERYKRQGGGGNSPELQHYGGISRYTSTGEYTMSAQGTMNVKRHFFFYAWDRSLASWWPSEDVIWVISLADFPWSLNEDYSVPGWGMEVWVLPEEYGTGADDWDRWDAIYTDARCKLLATIPRNQLNGSAGEYLFFRGPDLPVNLSASSGEAVVMLKHSAENVRATGPGSIGVDASQVAFPDITSICPTGYTVPCWGDISHCNQIGNSCFCRGFRKHGLNVWQWTIGQNDIWVNAAYRSWEPSIFGWDTILGPEWLQVPSEALTFVPER